MEDPSGDRRRRYSSSAQYERRRQMWLVCGRAMLTVAILGLITILMYYVSEKVHEVETTVVPLSMNESTRYEIHNRTVIRGSRSRRSTRKFDPFLGLFPAVGATEITNVAPSIAWDRLWRAGEAEKVVVGHSTIAAPANEVDDLSSSSAVAATKIELPNSRNRKENVQSAASISINTDEDHLNSMPLDDRRVVMDSVSNPGLISSLVDVDDGDEQRLPQKNAMTLKRDRVENVPKIDRKKLLFDIGGVEEEEEPQEKDYQLDEDLVDQPQQLTVRADHVVDNFLDPLQGQQDANEWDRSKRKVEIYSREDVSYVFVPDCVTAPPSRLLPPWKYPSSFPGGGTAGTVNRRPHPQDYRDQRHRKRPQDYGRYSMYETCCIYHWWQRRVSVTNCLVHEFVLNS